MKSKKFSKKLALNKSTIADLNGNELKKVKGGCYPSIPPSCPGPTEIIIGTEIVCGCEITFP